MHLGQEYMAKCLGVDRTTYVRKERGSIPITTEEWIKLAEATEKDPSYFFQCADPPAEEEGDESAEVLLVKLYRALTEQERDEMICAMHLMLKGIRRHAVRSTLARLRSV